MRNVPNLLSALRLLIAPLLLISAWRGQEQEFLVLLTVALASDLIDGWVARRWQITSELGAKLDSWGDLTMYSSVALGSWWLWPELLRREASWVIAALLAFVLPTLLGFLKFQRLTSYHTWGAKLSSILMGAGFLFLFVFDRSAMFHFATAVLVVAETEEICMTLVLPHWKADVRSIVHAWRLRRDPRPAPTAPA